MPPEVIRRRDRGGNEVKKTNAAEMLANYAEQLGAAKERERVRKCLQDLERLAEQTADADEIRAAIRKACEEIAG